MSVGKVDAASGCGRHGASIGFVVILHHRSVGLRLIKCGPRDWLQPPRRPLISDRGSMQSAGGRAPARAARPEQGQNKRDSDVLGFYTKPERQTALIRMRAWTGCLVAPVHASQLHAWAPEFSTYLPLHHSSILKIHLVLDLPPPDPSPPQQQQQPQPSPAQPNP